MNQASTLEMNAAETVNYMRHFNNVFVTLLGVYLII